MPGRSGDGRTRLEMVEIKRLFSDGIRYEILVAVLSKKNGRGCPPEK